MGIGLAEPVILVHGSSHGAWCWDLLAPELKRLGHDVVAFDLPGAGARASGRPAPAPGTGHLDVRVAPVELFRRWVCWGSQRVEFAGQVGGLGHPDPLEDLQSLLQLVFCLCAAVGGKRAPA